MKKISVIFLLFAFNCLQIKAQIDFKKELEKISSETKIKPTLSEEEVGQGLKEALNRGIEKGVEQLAKHDGYFKDAQIKILMPSEAKHVEDQLRTIGQGKLVDDAIESLNRAAEDAASSAKSLFVDAIKNLTLRDVMNILHGSEDAATNYLKNNTRAKLIELFTPIIKSSLDKVGATKHWTAVFKTYNKLPMVKKVNPDLVDYTTDKAIDGLFIQIAKEEAQIRKNPAARVSELLKKVFG
ncbi:MAG: DUF4197 domain-containing protein [Flavobacteriia bacterium]|nr:DUF4197 domain-containing protein [Flavobacteriia bacterium]